jgi:DNA invertase Pin-like site-specific DNA recombinase
MPPKRTSGKAKTKDVFGHLHKAPKMLRAALYARVSTLDQQTIPMQMSALRECAANRGWTVAMQVKEVGSGAKAREKRQQLIDAARRREIDVVLVWRLDRWGRSLLDLVTTLQELTDLNVGFVSISEALDLTTSTGRAMAGMLSVFAAFERDILRDRVRARAGLDHARQCGTRLGRPATSAVKAAEVRKLFRQGVRKSQISRRLDIGRASVRRILAQKRPDRPGSRTLAGNSPSSSHDHQTRTALVPPVRTRLWTKPLNGLRLPYKLLAH